mmetsp:Transcript_43882/g.109459  ORF Transcript_43882/g.109459 Transcript_43882/m.109459 type:complete len:175 (-) Transcript_43882:67-591(-)
MAMVCLSVCVCVCEHYPGMGEIHMDKLKLLLFSGHDTTIAGMLDVMGVFDYTQPPFASSVFFELWERGKQHYVKVIYNGKELDPCGDGNTGGCRLFKFAHKIKGKMTLPDQSLLTMERWCMSPDSPDEHMFEDKDFLGRDPPKKHATRADFPVCVDLDKHTGKSSFMEMKVGHM